MEKVKISKSLRKLEKKVSDKLVKELYFNPKRRKELRDGFAQSQIDFLKTLEEPVRGSPTYDQAKNKYWADVFADQMGRMVDLIDNVIPRKLKERELVHSYFRLFGKPGSKFIAFECNYDKGIPKKHFLIHLLLFFGTPRKGVRTKAQLVRGKYDLKGFELLDEGTFTQKFFSFTTFQLTFKGKRKTHKFKLTPRGKNVDNHWLRVI